MRCDFHRRRLTPEDHARNRALGEIRPPVERSFGMLKRWYSYGRVRYRSLERNRLQLQLLAIAITCAGRWCWPPDGGLRLGRTRRGS